MLCTLKLFTQFPHDVDLAFIESRYGKLTELTVNDYYSYKTNIKNFQFSYDSYGLHLEGSVPRFVHGNNINTLKYHEIEGFINAMSESVGFDVSTMTITRIDITDNIPVDRAPRVYKRFLGRCRYFQRTDYSNNGLNYVNNTRNLLFYDKLMEMENKGGFVPASLVGKNLLRYEYSIRKRRKDHLGQQIQTLADLLLPANYLTLIDRWEAMFHRIEKISYQTTMSMPYRPGMKVKDWLCLQGVQLHGGMEYALQNFEELEALGHITRRQYDYLRDNLIGHQNRYNALQNAPGDLKEELVQKLRALAEENKRMI
ncbi:MAG: hypothetical protein EOP48_03525 [Sphingobacteriales bacterium]|nr:MAG: hypothetical protein EOP48_03525 [Sphingobacteriales bacterium]